MNQDPYEKHGSPLACRNNVTMLSPASEELSSGECVGPGSLVERGGMNINNDMHESTSLPEPITFRTILTSTPTGQQSPTLKRRASQGSIPASSHSWSKSNRSLQLPALESLGISNSVPSGSRSRTLPKICPPRSHTASPAQEPVTGGMSISATSASCSTVKDLSRCDYPPTLPPTPPADDGDRISWNPESALPVSDSQTNCEPKPQTHMDGRQDLYTRSSSESRDGICDPRNQQSSIRFPESDVRMSDDDTHDQPGPGTWLTDGIEATLSPMFVSDARSEPVKIVSQTLPYPRATGQHIKLPTNNPLLDAIVLAIQGRLQPGQSPFINIIHAVPGQFRLSSLPSSPPSTPSFLLLNEDYFSSTVFSSATPVPEYHDFKGRIQSAQFPSPIVPPRSVHIAILERYLPSSSTEEYSDFFHPTGPSILVDRLIELSPNGGSLLLIYPTKCGALTFKTQYLGPILDPLLRQLVVVNELSADVGRYLGSMASVAHMDDFEAMKANVTRLCQTFSSSTSQFTLVETGKGAAFLDRRLWTDWYIQQERPRIKEVLNFYWQNGRRFSLNKFVPPGSRNIFDSKEVTSAMLLTEILDGIRKRPYSEDSPREAVELGFFVIRRSH